MSQEELLSRVMSKAQQWLSEGYDTETRTAVKNMMEATDKTPLIEAFWKDLEFGTGGLRGIMGPGSNRINKYTVGGATQGLANYLKKEFSHKDQIKVVVGHDCRNNSKQFARIVAEVFAANSIKVYLFEDLRPTPEISYAIRKLGCQSGVMLTASHNPKEYNGYKAYWEDGAQMISPHDKNTIAEVNSIRDVHDIKFDGPDELIEVIGKEVDEQFIRDIVSLSLSPDDVKAQSDMKIVYTPIHGTGYRMVPEALRSFGFKHIINVPEQDVVSGDFPTVKSPNPEDPMAMKMVMDKAKETDADLVLASDPDADRIAAGIKNKDGEWILLNGNQICLLFAYYAIEKRLDHSSMSNPYLVKTIVTTELIKALADKNNVKLYDCYTGFKWIAAVMRENEQDAVYLGGGEESYGYLWEDFCRDKDSVSACAILSEIAAWAKCQGLSIYDLLNKIYLEYGYSYERGISVVHKGKEGAELIENMMRAFREKPLQTIDGSPVTELLDYASLKGKLFKENEEFTLDMPTTSNVLQFKTEDGTKVSIRPSGTEPKIKFYIEVHYLPTSVEELEEKKKQAIEKVDRICRELSI